MAGKDQDLNLITHGKWNPNITTKVNLEAALTPANPSGETTLLVNTPTAAS